MSVLGWFLAFCGFVGLVVGLLQMLKGKKMNAVPFRAPGEIAQLGPGAADAKGLVSTEGAVGQQNLLTAPMSGRPCIAYELTIERKWEKSERTENGTQTKKGSDKLFGDYKGAMFALTDGQTQLWVDASEQPDASFEKAHSSTMNVGMLGVIPAMLQFGNFQMNTPSIVSLDSRTVGFEGTEKIVPPSATLYALGQINATPQGPVLATPKGIGTGKLILSNKGRASLVKSTKRNMVLGYALGGAMFVGGTLLGILGPKPAATASASACSAILTDAVSCDSRMFERDGKDLTWTVTTAGDYEVVVNQPNVKHPVDATLTIKDASGRQVGYNDGGSPGAPAKVKQHFEAGIYRVNVRDFARDKVSGGYGFHIDITKLETPALPAVASAGSDEPAPGTAASTTVTSAAMKPAGAAVAAPAAKAAGKAVPGKSAASAAPKTAAKK
jgi:hypothetical protein